MITAKTAITTSWVWAEYQIGWPNIWMWPKCVCVYKYNYSMRLNNPSQRKTGYKQAENAKNFRVSSSKMIGKYHPMVPPLDHFQGKNKNCSSLARTISLSRQSFFAYLTTFERRSGLKKFAILKITILKMGLLSKFQSHRSWGDAHLSFGAAQAPPN